MAPGMLWDPGRGGGAWWLPSSTPERGSGWVDLDLTAPPGTDGNKVVLATSQDLQWMVLGENRRSHIESLPAPWYPPAVAGDVIAWVARSEKTGEDIWVLERGAVRPLANGPGNERHPAASAESVAWLEEEGVVIYDRSTGEERRFPADVHTNTGLTLWGGVACWEVWDEGDIDIQCSDGLQVKGEGHQRHPARVGNALLYRENGQTWVVRREVPGDGSLDED